MDINNNHLVSDMEDLGELIKEDYQPVPPHLQNAAKKKLNGRNSAFVSKDSGGELSKWAAKERKKKRKLQKAAKKANR